MQAVLEITGLCKRFGGIVVADAIDLAIPAGRILGLIGPNGAGKTSLFNLVSGVVPPDAGTIRLDGTDIGGLGIPDRARLGLARTWQNLRLFPSLSVLDNLMIGARDYPGERLSALAFAGRRLRETARQARLHALEVLDQVGKWKEAGKGVAVATVIVTWGSSPRPVGSQLGVDDSGAMVGSVSGGCIEGAVVKEALDAIKDGKPRLLDFGVSDEQAWDVGLACGGKVQVFVEKVN